MAAHTRSTPEGGNCLAPLETGSYQTSTFTPALSYSVPGRWVNGEDFPGNFLLYRAQDPQEGFLGGSFTCIYQEVYAATHPHGHHGRQVLAPAQV